MVLEIISPVVKELDDGVLGKVKLGRQSPDDLLSGYRLTSWMHWRIPRACLWFSCSDSADEATVGCRAGSGGLPVAAAVVVGVAVLGC